jgi:hypothetical protein
MSDKIDLGAKTGNSRNISDLLQKQKTEDTARTKAIERAKLEHAQREQAIRQQNREREDSAKNG